MNHPDSSAVRAANDRSVLLGLLAMQFGLATRPQLDETLSTWREDRTRPFEEVLRSRCQLPAEKCKWLTDIASAHLRHHRDDAAHSLAALSALGQLRSDLCRLVDPAATLHVSPFRPSQPEGSAKASPEPARDSSKAGNDDRYKILRPLAAGGMGNLFVAVDRELNREIALKEIKPSLVADQQIKQRFQQEAQLTGRLAHPGVVPVYGAGCHADGRPFYAMRLIGGVSLEVKIKEFHGGPRDFASREFRQLLTHLVTVCNTVAYAHSRHIMHRDLKPANIMLGDYGETLLVDWGLAKSWGHEKALDSSGADRPVSRDILKTEAGAAIGTPAYMSPEQLAGEVPGFSPSPDIYSLGATLYHLITGEPPYYGWEREAALDAIGQGSLPAPRTIRAEVPQSLEAICLKAMARDPLWRYATALELAADLENYLAGEPVTALRESRIAQASRWMRKHRPLVASATVAGVVLFAASLVYAVQTNHHNRALTQKNVELTSAYAAETRAKQEADQRRTDAEHAKQESENARQETEQVLDAFVASLRRPEPSLNGEQVTVMQVMELLAKEMQSKPIGGPAVQARLWNTIGQTYRGIGKYSESEAMHRRALEIAEPALGDTHLLTLESVTNLGRTLRLQARVDEAVPLFERAVATLRERKDYPDRYVVLTLADLGAVYSDARRYQEAVDAIDQAYVMSLERLGEPHADSLKVLNRLGHVFAEAGDFERATVIFERVLKERRQRFGMLNADTLISCNNLASAYLDLGRLEEALALFEEALPLLVRSFGPDHPQTLSVEGNLGSAYLRSGRVKEAIPLLAGVSAKQSEKLGPNHPTTQITNSTLAKAYLIEGDIEHAQPLFDGFVDAQRKALGESYDFVNLLTDVAGSLVQYKQPAHAATYLTEAVTILDKEHAKHPLMGMAKSLLGECQAAAQKDEEGESLLLEGFEILHAQREQLPGNTRQLLTDAIQRLINFYSARQKSDEAQMWQEKLNAWQMTIQANE